MSVRDHKKQKPVSYYEVLQISQNASDSDIRKAYYKMAKLFHPDHHPAERRLAELRFRLINEAYNTLRTKEKRLQYNRSYRQAMKNFKTLSTQAGNDNVSSNNGKKTFLNVISELFGLTKHNQTTHM